jgi:hypothetical protein
MLTRRPIRSTSTARFRYAQAYWWMNVIGSVHAIALEWLAPRERAARPMASPARVASGCPSQPRMFVTGNAVERLITAPRGPSVKRMRTGCGSVAVVRRSRPALNPFTQSPNATGQVALEGVVGPTLQNCSKMSR